MKNVMFVMVAGVTGVALAGTAAVAGPSFDCRKASVPTEHAICGSSLLSNLDVQLASAFKAMRSALCRQAGLHSVSGNIPTCR